MKGTKMRRVSPVTLEQQQAGENKPIPSALENWAFFGLVSETPPKGFDFPSFLSETPANGLPPPAPSPAPAVLARFRSWIIATLAAAAAAPAESTDSGMPPVGSYTARPTLLRSPGATRFGRF